MAKHERCGRPSKAAQTTSEDVLREQYRKRAATAPLILTAMKPKTEIIEAVYWPGEGYGGPTACLTMAEAEASARCSLMRGYGRPSKVSRTGVVRIVETVTRVIEVSIAE